MHAFSIFVFAPVQRNLACFTWKSALEIAHYYYYYLLLLSLYRKPDSQLATTFLS